MRVIAGSARHLPLKAPKGDSVRPTTDRIKETLFNILNPYICDCCFLDLFSGSGAIAIEALSRGAGEAVLVENASASIKVINENLKFTKLEGKAKVISQDAVSCITYLKSIGKKFDLIFMDPPYNMELEKKVLYEISKCDILAEDGMIIVEASAETDLDYLDQIGFEITKEKSYGSNKHIFIRAK